MIQPSPSTKISTCPNVSPRVTNIPLQLVFATPPFKSVHSCQMQKLYLPGWSPKFQKSWKPELLKMGIRKSSSQEIRFSSVPSTQETEHQGEKYEHICNYQQGKATCTAYKSEISHSVHFSITALSLHINQGGNMNGNDFWW